MADIDFAGLALLLTALTSTVTTFVAMHTSRKVTKVHGEVTTMNGQTMAPPR